MNIFIEWESEDSIFIMKVIIAFQTKNNVSRKHFFVYVSFGEEEKKHENTANVALRFLSALKVFRQDLSWHGTSV